MLNVHPNRELFCNPGDTEPSLPSQICGPGFGNPMIRIYELIVKNPDIRTMSYEQEFAQPDKKPRTYRALYRNPDLRSHTNERIRTDGLGLTSHDLRPGIAYTE